jgi:FkbM family methyltransferase
MREIRMEQGRFVYDVGMHSGEDVAYYLHTNYSVVAIEANPQLVEEAKKKFDMSIRAGRLTILNCAISERDDERVKFFVSKNSIWSSLKPEIANRQDLQKEVIEVQTRKLSSIMKEYGVPQYCKIDIEGYDIVALKTLAELRTLPRYMSVEAECADDLNQLSEEQALQTLETLGGLGYKKFKLVDELTLRVLSPAKEFYRKSFFLKLLEHVGIAKMGREFVNRERRYEFSGGSSGPFGEDLGGEWLDFVSARKALLFHRRSYFSVHPTKSYGFWCDLHASM